MLRIVLFSISLLISSYCNAQIYGWDRLRQIKEIATKDSVVAAAYSKNDSPFDIKTDSLMPLNARYWYVRYRSNKSNIANGWYWPMESLSRNPIQYYMINSSYWVDLLPIRTYYCYFTDGVPDKTWDYVYDNDYTFDKPTAKDSTFNFVCKRENYNYGVLEGEFMLYNSVDTLYRTMFHQGTGRYREYDCLGRIIFDGTLIDSKREGIWNLYTYFSDSTHFPDKINITYSANGNIFSKGINEIAYFSHQFIDQWIWWERLNPSNGKKPKSQPQIDIPYDYPKRRVIVPEMPREITGVQSSRYITTDNYRLATSNDTIGPHQREYYSDGRLHLEGDLVDGNREGFWSYYTYDSDSTVVPTTIEIEMYEKGELLHKEIFYHFSYFKKIIAWEQTVPARLKYPYKTKTPKQNPYFNFTCPEF